MVLYFSGTGNSRYVAGRIAKAAGAEQLDINEKIRNQDTAEIETGTDIVIVTPTYAWRIPHVAEQWIRDTRFVGAQRAWFVMTCGDEAGNAAKYNRQLCSLKKWTYMGTAQIVMPENYIAMFAVPKPATAQKIISNAEPSIDETAAAVVEGRAFTEKKSSITDRIKSGIVNSAFYALFVKADAFRTTGGCIGCGKCSGICPMNNITMNDGKPEWGNHCTHCMACISYCPAEAIEYGKKSVGKPRYHYGQSCANEI